MSLADEILAELRVPDLPYPVGKGAEPEADWRPLLAACWQSRSDETVIQVLKARTETWSMRQVNAAYLADRMMDVFVRKSGLNPVLIQAVARLRFWLAWKLAAKGAEALAATAPIKRWLDTLDDLRGWSDTGGRSSKQVLDRLDAFHVAVWTAFDTDDEVALNAFVDKWIQEAETQHERRDRLRQRLLETESGAARQRAADQRAKAMLGRVLHGRQVPELIVDWVDRYWQPLLRQIALEQGTDCDAWRHAGRLLEWLVWASDPALSDTDRDRLYQVGEQLTDRIADVWQGVTGKAFDADCLDRIQSLLVTRLQGQAPTLVPAPSIDFDPVWLESVDQAVPGGFIGQWFVEGEGVEEQRRFLFAELIESKELLWTNGNGVKLAVTAVAEFLVAQENGHLQLLPPLNSFADVLQDTLMSLGKVLDVQRGQRKAAVEKARLQAEALKKAREEAEAKAREDAERKAAAEATAKATAEREAAEAQALKAAAEEEKRVSELYAQVDGVKLGGWIALTDDEGTELRLKLAVRINASGKLLFVDRLGLNRREILRDEMLRYLQQGKVRILSSGAEFEDTLSRVVGRIRVGKQ